MCDVLMAEMFFFIYREELAMRVDLTEARVQVSISRYTLLLVYNELIDDQSHSLVKMNCFRPLNVSIGPF